MFRKKNRSKKRARAMLSAYSIIMILIVLLGILSHVLPKAKYMAAPVEGELAGVEIGPGEWEGEMPADGLTEQDGNKPSESGEIELPEGESLEPVVGNEATSESEPISKDNVTTDNAVNSDTKKDPTADDVSTNEDVDAPGEVTESETFDSLAECEEVHGEGVRTFARPHRPADRGCSCPLPRTG